MISITYELLVCVGNKCKRDKIKEPSESEKKNIVQ